MSSNLVLCSATDKGRLTCIRVCRGIDCLRDGYWREQRIKELEQQLELMSQKAQFFETVVDVLKNYYGVSVIKKRSGKSSRKVKSKD